MSPSPSLESVYSALKQSPGLVQHLTINSVAFFVRLVAQFRRRIVYSQPPSDADREIPVKLPQEITDFVGSAVGLSAEQVGTCWDALKYSIWAYDVDNHSEIGVARTVHTHSAGLLASRSLYPPVNVCTNPNCLGDNKLLRVIDKPGRKVVLYTMGDGACAAYHYKLRCALCKTTYHHNYSVSNRVRTYYGGVPDIIEIGKHQFVERSVANLFINLMLISWTSATNSAEIYNRSLAHPENQPADWGFTFDIRPEHIWEAFSHLAILEDFQRENMGPLVIPHGKEQKDRLKGVIQQRNDRFASHGQPEWAHYCNKCVSWWYGEDGKSPKEQISAIVTDGVTIGHPCCSVADCTKPLENKQDRYCVGHYRENFVCAAEGCSKPISGPGKRSCSDASHSALEDGYKKRNRANFQLKKGLERTSVATPPDEATLSGLYEAAEAPGDGVEVCPSKPDSGNRKLKARFGRKQTHNEQIFARPCGIIVARSTFFNSESVPQTVAMFKHVFRTPESMPSFLIYDNCCSVYNYLLARKDPLVTENLVGFPVDVFHYDTKHKRTDVVCQKHCNPHKFKELLKEDGTWVFNTSICEQINVWLGGYHAILREMNAGRYNFLLDELIMRRNWFQKAKLEKAGHLPGLKPDLVFYAGDGGDKSNV